MGPGEWAPVMVITVLAAVCGMTMVLRGPLGRALARRLDGGARSASGDGDEAARLRVVESRLLELEERLDFTERLLTRVDQEGRGAPPT